MLRKAFVSVSVLTVVLAVTTSAAAAVPRGLRDALQRRYRPSRIALDGSGRAGMVMAQGTVLIVEVDGVPANPLRVVRYPASPRSTVPAAPRHLANYARFDVPPAGPPVAEPAAFTLPKGARVVVLDMKVNRASVRLFTHTVRPVTLPDGRVEYGCTEFVFRVDPSTIERSDVAAIETTIGRWLRPAA